LQAKMATDSRPKGGVSPGALRAIKVAVILMGLLILGGMGVIVVTLINRASNLGDSETADGPGTAEGAGPGESDTAGGLPVTRPLGLAVGDRIESAVIDGGRVLLVVARADGGQDVIVVDLESGDRVLTLEGSADAE